MSHALFDRSNPYLSQILERSVLNKPGASRETWHVSLDLKGSNISYAPGDSIAILPKNDPKKVRDIVALFSAPSDVIVEDAKGGVSTFIKFLEEKANLAAPPKKLAMELVHLGIEGEKQLYLQKLLAEGNDDHIHLYLASFDVAEFLQEHRAKDFTPQGLSKLLLPLIPRFYSIASSQSVVGDEVHLTVARVIYDVHGKERRGVCSHYLCDVLNVHERTVQLYLHPTRDFRLPESPQVPIIMVGPGTGVAPYRAFMQERALRKEQAQKSWLFFGERNQKTDFFYQEFWEELVGTQVLRIDTAFSRDQEAKIYVQDRMWEHREALWQWLQEGAIIYVCGDSKRMAKDVDHCLQRIVQEAGNHTEEEVRSFMKKLRTDKRYLRDVY